MKCGHPLCKKCYQEYKSLFLENDLILCDTCQSQLIIQDPDEIEEEKAEISPGIVPNFMCLIDQTEHSMDDACTLECNHRFCRDCVSGYILDKISRQEICENKLTCPQCIEPISPHIIKASISKEKYALLTEMRLYNTKIDKKYQVKQCPFCDCYCGIPISKPSVICPNSKCKKVYCPQCNQDVHPNQKCNNGSSLEIEDIQTCPVCHEGYFKENGCNFMSCPFKCGKKTHFCFLCGEKLERSEHYSHYKKSGPYGNTCNTLDLKQDN